MIKYVMVGLLVVVLLLFNPPEPDDGHYVKRAVPFFSQVDDNWRLVKMGGETCACPPIGQCGCTVTSVAMIFSFLGYEVTPRELSECMGDRACPMQWEKAVSRCGKGVVKKVKDYKFSWARLERLVKAQPVIIGLERNNYKETHFVVVLSGAGTNYKIHDPKYLTGANDLLSNYTSEDWKPYLIIVYKGK